MASYMGRDIDKPLWARLRERARSEGRSVKAVIESLIAAWLAAAAARWRDHSRTS
jgi:plasmid stability protein